MKAISAKIALIAATSIGALGTASAQSTPGSSIAVFGVIDARVMYAKTSAGDLWQVGSGGTTSTRLGFRGVEDLGGGMSASFWIESNFNIDNGTGAFTNTNNQVSGLIPAGGGMLWNFRSTVSLTGAWGEVRAGRDFVPSYRNYSTFDPWGDNGASIPVVMPTTSNGLGIIPATTMTSIRASNNLAYYLPGNLGGVYGQANVWLGENASNTPTKKDGTGQGFRLGYAAGPLDVAVSWQQTDYLAGNVRQLNIGGAYTIGATKLMGLYVTDKLGATEAKGWQIGANVPFGLTELRVAYSSYKVNLPTAAPDPSASKLALGLVYNLSKRTAVYGTVAEVINRDGARVTINGAPTTGPNQKAGGIDVGIRHFF